MRKVQIGLCVATLCILVAYLIVFLCGLRPIVLIEKALVILVLALICVNIGIYMVSSFKGDKTLNGIIAFQIELVGIFTAFIIAKNFTDNMFMVNKNNNSYMMRVNVNDNSKDYYLLKNNLFVKRDVAIKEYLKDTTLSYEENTPSKIVFNKKLLPEEIDKEVIDTTKKIVSSTSLDSVNDRVYENIENVEELNSFKEKYNINAEYSDEYFNSSAILVVSYRPYNETIPYIAKGEDNNIYVYIKEDNMDETGKQAFSFIEYKKEENIKDIVIEDYNEKMKNEEIK